MRYAVRFVACLLGIVSMGLGACGGEAPPVEAPKVEPKADEGPRRAAVPSIESEVGALDAAKVKQTFTRAQDKIMACYTKGAQRIPYLAGEVRFQVRVARDGRARVAWPEESSLGDRETEACMTEVLETASWPKPEGGEGIAHNSFNFSPGDDERPPVAWTPDRLGAAFKAARPKLAQCRKQVGGKELKATFYVDTDGKAKAVGVSGPHEKTASAAACVAATIGALKLPSPGSWPAKVSVAIE